MGGTYQAASHVIEISSKSTAVPPERVCKLSGVLRLFNAERVKWLHTNEDDFCVEEYAGKMDKVWLGKHRLRLHGIMSSDEVSILVQARTEHCALNICLCRNVLACEWGRRDETVLHVLLGCKVGCRSTQSTVGGSRLRSLSYLYVRRPKHWCLPRDQSNPLGWIVAFVGHVW